MTVQALKGLVIAVGGTFPGFKQADLKNIVSRQGGKFSSTVTEECTHLITTEKEVDNRSVKYTQARKVYTCNIVSLAWLVDSDAEGKRLDEKDFLMGADNNQDEDEDEEEEKPKKRTLEEALGVQQDGTTKKFKDAQTIGTKSLNVPVDETCPLRAHYAVYIDPSGLIWDATLNQTSASNNNNKFYRVQLLTNSSKSDFKTWTHWGRVGELGQHALLGDGSHGRAEAEFKKKFKDKSGLTWENRLDPPKGSKYTFIERNYEEGSDDEDEDDKAVVKKPSKAKAPEVKSTLPAAVQNLIAFIFNQDLFNATMAAMSYDAQKLPLGKLSKRTLLSGFEALKNLSELVANPNLAADQYGLSFNEAAEHISNLYFTFIPHVFGRNRPPVLVQENLIKREIELLETLTDMEVANSIMKAAKDVDTVHQLDRQFQGLGMQEMSPLDHTSTEFIELHDYLIQSRGATHGIRYNVINIFRIERQGENDRFQSSKFAKMKKSSRRLLWHGSRSTNFGGILSQGLRIAPPEAPVSGYMFGKGVYFADMSTKSANYCCSWGSGNQGLLLLCDVEVGNPMLELDGGNFNAGEDAVREGKVATLGRGSSIPSAWKDASCVHPSLKGVTMPDVSSPAANAQSRGLLYNEYIVYDVAQIRQKYLFQVDMR
ncbi:poly polymerase [Aspergillus heteromorphus CBS 117.55]|uniref:Poly [ADP-ribose] polymerase n=1 Tax=Aspergillus heteromorphus CBS 117.55 TaxID=1448321 RepID=A0A317WE67_9EURO|nr:poly polymerase [Aspergillus heteromorphus CBS 117.55]PWY84776.1 poly polymerase [Aspergillus heteromorphus CBS 117.55]